MSARLARFGISAVLMTACPVAATAQAPSGAVSHCAAFSGGPSRPSAPLVNPDLEETPISGGETLAWEYAGTLGSPETPRFVAYVDNRPAPLPTVSCDAADSGFLRTCPTRLPPLTPGPHTIQVAAVAARGTQLFEGHPSTSIRVRLARPAPASATAAERVRETVTADGVQLRAAMIASDLVDP